MWLTGYVLDSSTHWHVFGGEQKMMFMFNQACFIECNQVWDNCMGREPSCVTEIKVNLLSSDCSKCEKDRYSLQTGFSFYYKLVFKHFVIKLYDSSSTIYVLSMSCYYRVGLRAC